ncbi:hypothetical protein PAXRUDRAFT_446257 [Paxillus rubicundulus Ve08.2h10]|uniref:Uncharacterized protein n=1 Tax=Paxillus rubicundulus Ve08.2h10 TaxID=930991 RepID=A0A0D0DEY5_9AGAM|nr:hypothetical protein PAXRUDRAFT_446257 [Paxillus rubicundulus Ve08.2h10]
MKKHPSICSPMNTAIARQTDSLEGKRPTNRDKKRDTATYLCPFNGRVARPFFHGRYQVQFPSSSSLAPNDYPSLDRMITRNIRRLFQAPPNPSSFVEGYVLLCIYSQRVRRVRAGMTSGGSVAMDGSKITVGS